MIWPATHRSWIRARHWLARNTQLSVTPEQHGVNSSNAYSWEEIDRVFRWFKVLAVGHFYKVIYLSVCQTAKQIIFWLTMFSSDSLRHRRYSKWKAGTGNGRGKITTRKVNFRAMCHMVQSEEKKLDLESRQTGSFYSYLTEPFMRVLCGSTERQTTVESIKANSVMNTKQPRSVRIVHQLFVLLTSLILIHVCWLFRFTSVLHSSPSDAADEQRTLSK